MKIKKLIIFYDNWCPKCTRFAGIVRRFDWLKLIEIKGLRNEEEIQFYQGIDIELAKKQMASYNKHWYYGYVSIFFIMMRIPLFWPLVPLLFVLHITGLGQLGYVQLAVKRTIIPLHCDLNGCNIE